MGLDDVLGGDDDRGGDEQDVTVDRGLGIDKAGDAHAEEFGTDGGSRGSGKPSGTTDEPNLNG